MHLETYEQKDISSYIRKDICDVNRHTVANVTKGLAECFVKKYCANLYDSKCIFDYEYTGSKCFTRDGCISVVVSCQDQGFDILCGIPELLLLRKSYDGLIETKGAVSRFISFVYERGAEQCDLKLIIGDKVVVSKHKDSKYIDIDKKANQILENDVLSRDTVISKNPENNMQIYRSQGGEVRKKVKYADSEALVTYAAIIGFLLISLGLFVIITLCCMFRTTSGISSNRMQYIDSNNMNRGSNQNNSNNQNIIGECLSRCLDNILSCFRNTGNLCITALSFVYQRLANCFRNACQCNLLSCNLCNQTEENTNNSPQTLPHGVVNGATTEFL